MRAGRAHAAQGTPGIAGAAGIACTPGIAAGLAGTPFSRRFATSVVRNTDGMPATMRPFGIYS